MGVPRGALPISIVLSELEFECALRRVEMYERRVELSVVEGILLCELVEVACFSDTCLRMVEARSNIWLVKLLCGENSDRGCFDMACLLPTPKRSIALL